VCSSDLGGDGDGGGRGRPQNGPGPPSSGQFAVAIYSEDLNAHARQSLINDTLIPAALETKQGQKGNLTIIDTKEVPNHPFFIVIVGSSPEAFALQSAKLPEFPRAVMPLEHWESIAKFLDEKATEIIGDGSVDLSNLKANGLQPDLDTRDVISFVIFYAGALCRKHRQKIEKLGFVNEPIKSMTPLGYVKDQFPDLTTLVLRTDWMEQKGYGELRNRLEMNGVRLETADVFRVGSRLEKPAPNAWIRFLMEQGPREVINLVVGDVLFPVSPMQLEQTCELFRSKPELRSRPNYVVRTVTSPGVFQIFRQALDRSDVEVTPQNCD
jgi:hypothetical protein